MYYQKAVAPFLSIVVFQPFTRFGRSDHLSNILAEEASLWNGFGGMHTPSLDADDGATVLEASVLLQPFSVGTRERPIFLPA